MKAYNKHIALFLLAIISAFIVPKELTHALYEHEDTVHTWSHNQNGLPALENEHQHCDILNFNVPLYFLSLNFFSAPEVVFSSGIIQQVTEIFFAPHTGLCSLRAPPTC